MAKKKKSEETPTGGAHTASKSPSTASRGAWKALDAGSAMLAGLLAPRIAQVVWRAATGKSAPHSTRSPEISMGEALLWAAVAGALAQMIRTGAARSAASYWERSTGEQPPAPKSKKIK